MVQTILGGNLVTWTQLWMFFFLSYDTTQSATSAEVRNKAERQFKKVNFANSYHKHLTRFFDIKIVLH